MDSIVHFEIPAGNEKRAKKFYESIFGWKITPVPKMDYHMVLTTKLGKNRMPKRAGAINGGMVKRSKTFKAPVVTIDVDSIDSSVKKISGKGGRLVVKKMPVMNMGFIAYFKDPEGNVMGLWETAKK